MKFLIFWTSLFWTSPVSQNHKIPFFWKNAISGKDKKIQFSKNTLRSNHKIPYFEDKACFAKPWNSLFFGEVFFAENTKFLIFWTPHFR